MTDKGFLDFVMQDVLSRVDGVSARAMFGGYGIYKDGVIFAIIADGLLYFKVDSTNQKDYESHGCRPFVYQQGNHKPTQMSYWTVPEELLEDPEAIIAWAHTSYAISRKQKRKTVKKK